MEAENRSSTLNVCLRIKPHKHPNEQNTYSVTSKQDLKVKSWRGEEVYKFSHIFNVESLQEEVFAATAEPAVKSFLQGTDCLLFAYGATNAGKTYSVQGNASNPGIVPRAIASIFASIKGHIDVSPHIAPGNYATAQLRGMKEKLKAEKIKSLILSPPCHQNMSQAVHLPLSMGNCSLSFSTALSSTVSVDFDPAGDADTVECSSVEELGWCQASRCSIWISMVEVYNENVLDLLSGTKTHTKVAVVSDSDGRFYPQGQTEINVSTLKEAKTVIQFGNKQRKNAATLLNIASSRSHCILRLRLLRADRLGANPLQLGPQSPAAFDVDDFHVSTFMFCDLAGAERVNKAGNKGDRARETANINSSLVVLGRCLETLRLKGGALSTSRNVVVPYRESRLTMILQPLLSEPGPKSLLVNISTSPELFDETLNVLKFSAVARVVVVKEHVRLVPHYQLPTHTKQLLELRAAQELQAAQELDDSRMRISQVKEELEALASTAEAATQTDRQQTKESGTEESLDATVKEVVLQEQNLAVAIEQAISQEQAKHSQEITVLKQKVASLQQQLIKIEYERRNSETTIRNDLFESFDKLEKQKEEDHKEQLQNTETMLYNLMNDRLNIQENYYQEMLGKSESENKLLQEQLQVVEAALVDWEQLSKQDSNKLATEIQDLKKSLTEETAKLESQASENKGLLHAYGEKDKELEEIKIDNENLNKVLEKRNSELADLNLKYDVKVHMLSVNATSLNELKIQNEALFKANTKYDKKVDEIQKEVASCKEAGDQKDVVAAELLKRNASLEEDLAKTTKELENDNKILQQEIKNLLQLVKNPQTEKFSKEKIEELQEQLEKSNASALRYKQFYEYLMDQYRPDARRSIAGCASEAAALAIIEKEIQAIPSRCAELQRENQDLKSQLETKELDKIKLTERWDALVRSMECKLQQKTNELDTCKRETQTLSKQLLGMTPRKQDGTPQITGFKTPLRASFKHLPTSASSNFSANNSASKLFRAEESLRCDMGDVDGSVPVTSAKRKRGEKTESVETKEEEIVSCKKSSSRRKASRSKVTPCKENMEPPAPPLFKDNKEDLAPAAVAPHSPVLKKTTPKPKKRSGRRKLCTSSLHPALDCDETPVNVDMPPVNPLKETQRRLRSTYKY